MNSKHRCSCEHNDDIWQTAGVQLYAIFTFTLDGTKWWAAYPKHVMPEKESLLCIVQEAGWAPQPVWTFWRRGNLLSLPGNKPIFLGCPAGSPFTTRNELSYLMYDCVRTGRTYYIGTACQSVVKHNHSGQLEPMKMNGLHPWGGRVFFLNSVYCSMPHYRVILHALYYWVLDLHESFTIISYKWWNYYMWLYF